MPVAQEASKRAASGPWVEHKALLCKPRAGANCRFFKIFAA